MRLTDGTIDRIERLGVLYAASRQQQRHLAISSQSLGWGLLGASSSAEQQMISAIRQQPAAAGVSQVAGSWVVALFSHNERRGLDFARINQIAHADVNLADLLQRREIQCVYVSSHPRHHYPLTMAALNAGKHVLCETPLALTLDEAQALQQTATNRGLVLGVNYVQRANPAVQKVHALLQQGAIGDLLGGRISNTDLLPPSKQTWRLQANGGGVIFDRTIHDIDLLRFLLNDEIATVYGLSTQPILSEANKHQVEENVLAQIQMRRHGVTFQVHDSYFIGHQPTSIELYGSQGTFRIFHWFGVTAESQLWLHQHSRSEQLSIPNINPYWQMVYLFNSAVRNHTPLLAQANDGVAGLAAALQLHKSIRDKVAVPLPALGDP
jgi:1,5-anhydro-D-fructose reductase (1,5-anhydro-D-mannitol-forming)